MFALPTPSKEQKNVISNINNNIVVNSVAGSGKTTTILHIAQHIEKTQPLDKILLLTYNKKLKIETRRKVINLGITNIEVHSYHSCIVKYYNSECHNDYNLMHHIDNFKSTDLKPFSLIVIDEAQDMCALYYKFVNILVADLLVLEFPPKQIKFAIIGDKFQSIFDFNGADYRFIDCATQLFGNLSEVKDWANCNLSMSYRITNQMAAFLNGAILKMDRLKANKNGDSVDYVICNVFNQSYTFFKNDIINNYKYGDIFILAASVKSPMSPVRKFANLLSNDGLPIYVPGSDEEPLDEEVLNGKIVFSTFHQVKGLERKCVLVFGFDQSYFDFHEKHKTNDVCPNTLYVALTRASEKLILFHHYENNFLKFLNAKKLKKYCRIKQLITSKHLSASQEKQLQKIEEQLCDLSLESLTIQDETKTTKKTDWAVCDLLRHLPVTTIYDAMKCVQSFSVVESSDLIEIRNKINGIVLDGDKLIETCAEINGTALAAYFEYKITDKITIKEEIKNSGKKEISQFILGCDNFTYENLLKYSTAYCADRSGYMFKLNQIANYDWIHKSHFEFAFERMKQYISNNCKFEYNPRAGKFKDIYNIQGRIDILDIDNKTIWEIKAVSAIKPDHILQLAIYGYLYNNANKNDPYKCKLFNILDGNIIEISANENDMENIIEELIRVKQSAQLSLSDEKFIAELLNVKKTSISNVISATFEVPTVSQSSVSCGDLLQNDQFLF